MYDIELERKEAIEAGDRALNSLSQAYFELKSAKNWGLVDLFGGGFFTTMIKHSKMEKAQSYMEQAKYDLRRFGKEVRDMDGYINLNVDMDDFLSFADYFFDGFLADWFVQSKINKAQEQVERAIHRVEDIMEQIKR